MRKILICTPLRGGLSATYLDMAIKLILSRIPNVSIALSTIGVPAVQWARDECVQMARDRGCGEIVFWDADIEPTPEDWVRLLSNDTTEILCGLYAKRGIPTHWHATFMDGKEPDANGLCEVFQCAIGFSKIRMTAFDKMRDRSPERAYIVHHADETNRRLHEYFPMERFGPNTAAGKLKRIKSLFEEEGYQSYDPLNDTILEILTDSDYSTNQMHGEDYSFCRLAKEAGIPITLDTRLIVGHRGECVFPVATEVLEKELAAEWRKSA
jgi:hypothetical protein